MVVCNIYHRNTRTKLKLRIMEYHNSIIIVIFLCINIMLQSSSNSEKSEDLILVNVTMEDAGEYTCAAQNHIGIGHKTAWLTVYNDSKNYLFIFE